MPRELIFLLFVFAIIGCFWRHTADLKHLRDLQQAATRAFAGLVYESKEDRYRLVGSEAVVDRREETGGSRGLFESTASLSVTIYAHNDYGERFIFKWHSKSKQQPFVNHLPKHSE
jgi:hypothetical protein